MKYKIYKIYNVITKKYYIGITSQSIKARFAAHFSESKRLDTNKFKRALRKYNINNWVLCLLEETTTLNDANEKEKYYIKEYNTFENGYNSTKGGCGSVGRIFSTQTKKKMSEKAKIRANTETGRKLLSENGKLRKDIKQNKQHKLNRSKSLKGHAVSEKTRTKISDSLKGNIPWNKGKHTPLKDKTYEEIYGKNKALLKRKKLSEKMKKTREKNRKMGNFKNWLLINPSGKEFIVDDLVEFSKRNNLDPAGFRRVSNGTTKQYKGWNAIKLN